MVYPFSMPVDDESQRPRIRPSRSRRPVAAYEDLGTVLRHRNRRGRGSTVTPWVPPTIIALVAIGVAAFVVAYLHQRSRVPSAVPPTPARHAVIFVLSGVPVAALQRSDLPSIGALRKRGVSYRDAWVGQMANVPVAASATIGTGTFPARDGVVNSQWRDPNSGALVRPTQFAAVQQGQLDQIMETAAPPSLASALAGETGQGRTLSVGGEGCATADAAGSWMAAYVLCPERARHGWIPSSVTGHAPPASVTRPQGLRVRAASGSALAPSVEGWRAGAEDAWIARYTIRAMRATRPKLTIVNFPEYEALGRYTPKKRSGLLRFVLRGIDRDIGAVVREVRREGIDRSTVYVVASDGGMTAFRSRVPVSSINRAVLSAGGQPVYYERGGTLMIGLRDVLQAQPVAQSIQSAALRGIDAIYYKTGSHGSYRYVLQYLRAALPASYPTAAAYLLDTMASPPSPDVIVIFSPGAGSPGFPAGKHPNTGSSMGTQWSQQHIPLIIAGHGVVQNRTSSSPARLVDIAPTVAASMGVQLQGSSGAVLEDAFLHQHAAQLTRQRAVDARLRGYVRVLRSTG